MLPYIEQQRLLDQFHMKLIICSLQETEHSLKGSFAGVAVGSFLLQVPCKCVSLRA